MQHLRGRIAKSDVRTTYLRIQHCVSALRCRDKNELVERGESETGIVRDLGSWRLLGLFFSYAVSMGVMIKSQRKSTMLRVSAKPGLWTLDWTVDWTLDCILDWILDRIFGLDFVRMAQKACQRSLYLCFSGCLWERRGVATLRSAGGGFSAKPGLWTLDWTVDWTLDCILDWILDRIFGLDFVRMAQKACQRSLYLCFSGCLWERRGVATLRSAGGGWGSILQDYFCWGNEISESGRSWQNRACAVDCYAVCCLVELQD